MANSDGVYKRIKKSNDNAIKCNLMDKKDLLEPFRVKYAMVLQVKVPVGNNQRRRTSMI